MNPEDELFAFLDGLPATEPRQPAPPLGPAPMGGYMNPDITMLDSQWGMQPGLWEQPPQQPTPTDDLVGFLDGPVTANDMIPYTDPFAGGLLIEDMEPPNLVSPQEAQAESDWRDYAMDVEGVLPEDLYEDTPEGMIEYEFQPRLPKHEYMDVIHAKNRWQDAEKQFAAGAISEEQRQNSLLDYQLADRNMRSKAEIFQREEPIREKLYDKYIKNATRWDKLAKSGREKSIERLPVVGDMKEAVDWGLTMEALDRIKGGSTSEGDYIVIGKFLRGMADEAALAADDSWGAWGERTADIALEMPGFMLEFIGSGGVAASAVKGGKKLGKKVVSDAIQKWIKEHAEDIAYKMAKTKTRRAVATAVGGAASAVGMGAVQTGALPQQVAANYQKERLSNFDAAGAMAGDKSAIENWEPVDAGTSLTRALGDTHVEVTTERLGTVIAPVLGKLAAGTGVKALSAKLLGRLATEGNEGAFKAAVRTYLMKAGYDGIPEEIMEERIGEMWRYAVGLSDDAGVMGDLVSMEPKRVKQGFWQLASEATAFGLGPGTLQAGAAGADALIRNIEQGPTEYTVDGKTVPVDGSIKNKNIDDYRKAKAVYDAHVETYGKQSSKTRKARAEMVAKREALQTTLAEAQWEKYSSGEISHPDPSVAAIIDEIKQGGFLDKLEGERKDLNDAARQQRAADTPKPPPLPPTTIPGHYTSEGPDQEEIDAYQEAVITRDKSASQEKGVFDANQEVERIQDRLATAEGQKDQFHLLLNEMGRIDNPEILKAWDILQGKIPVEEFARDMKGGVSDLESYVKERLDEYRTDIERKTTPEIPVPDVPDYPGETTLKYTGPTTSEGRATYPNEPGPVDFAPQGFGQYAKSEEKLEDLTQELPPLPTEAPEEFRKSADTADRKLLEPSTIFTEVSEEDQRQIDVLQKVVDKAVPNARAKVHKTDKGLVMAFPGGREVQVLIGGTLDLSDEEFDKTASYYGMTGQQLRERTRPENRRGFHAPIGRTVLLRRGSGRAMRDGMPEVIGGKSGDASIREKNSADEIIRLDTIGLIALKESLFRGDDLSPAVKTMRHELQHFMVTEGLITKADLDLLDDRDVGYDQKEETQAKNSETTKAVSKVREFIDALLSTSLGDTYDWITSLPKSIGRKLAGAEAPKPKGTRKKAQKARLSRELASGKRLGRQKPAKPWKAKGVVGRAKETVRDAFGLEEKNKTIGKKKAPIKPTKTAQPQAPETDEIELLKIDANNQIKALKEKLKVVEPKSDEWSATQASLKQLQEWVKDPDSYPGVTDELRKSHVEGRYAPEVVTQPVSDEVEVDIGEVEVEEPKKPKKKVKKKVKKKGAQKKPDISPEVTEEDYSERELDLSESPSDSSVDNMSAEDLEAAILEGYSNPAPAPKPKKKTATKQKVKKKVKKKKAENQPEQDNSAAKAEFNDIAEQIKKKWEVMNPKEDGGDSITADFGITLAADIMAEDEMQVLSAKLAAASYKGGNRNYTRLVQQALDSLGEEITRGIGDTLEQGWHILRGLKGSEAEAPVKIEEAIEAIRALANNKRGR